MVVPDRQLSLAIGKEGQNTRLAARLTGWRQDIKGLTEWEELREERLKKAQEQVALEARSEAEVEATPAVIAEAETVAAEAEAAAVEAASAAEAKPVVAEAAEAVTADLDEEKILEALLKEEEESAQQAEVTAVEQAEAGFSVEDLEAFTLTDMSVADEPFDEEDAGEEREATDLDVLPGVPVLTPDAGKIRFAEDIVDETRGSGRRDRRSRRGAGASRGPRKGGR